MFGCDCCMHTYLLFFCVPDLHLCILNSLVFEHHDLTHAVFQVWFWQITVQSGKSTGALPWPHCVTLGWGSAPWRRRFWKRPDTSAPSWRNMQVPQLTLGWGAMQTLSVRVQYNAKCFPVDKCFAAVCFDTHSYLWAAVNLRIIFWLWNKFFASFLKNSFKNIV